MSSLRFYSGGNLGMSAKTFWNSLSVQKALLADKSRNEAYFNALKELSPTHQSAVDLGSGTGILSFLAAKAGFKKVIGIEQTDIVKLAQQTCELNQLGNKVTFVENDLFKVRLSENVDVLIHDQIGDFVWNEDVIKKINFAKKIFLKPGGRILPFKIDVFFVPVSHFSSLIDLAVWEESIAGLKFSNFKKAELEQIVKNLRPRKVEIKNDSCFLAEPQLGCSLDLREESSENINLTLDFTLKNDGICTAILGFMEIHFTETISLKTAPSAGWTNWGQFSLQNKSQKICRQGDTINFKLKASPDLNSWDWSIT